jgi:hypothetical protein
MQVIDGEPAKPSAVPDQMTTTSIKVSVKEIFSNKTGNITKHQIIVTQFSDQNADSVTNYWSGDSKKPYIAIECPHFFNSDCPRILPDSKRRRRSSDIYIVDIVVGDNGSCPRTNNQWCNAKLRSSTDYYVIYRVCNENDQCSSVTSAKMQTNGII